MVEKLIDRWRYQRDHGYRCYSEIESLIEETITTLESQDEQRKQAQAETGQQVGGRSAVADCSGKRHAQEKRTNQEAERPDESVIEKHIKKCRGWGLWA